MPADLPATPTVSRRGFVTATAASLAAGAFVSASSGSRAAETPSEPFRYCFNTSTIRGQKLGIVKEIELVAKAGYHGIEPWIDELDEYVKAGGSLADLKKRIADHGLTVESAIGFAAFLHEDAAERQKGLEDAKRCMGLVRDIGGTRIAAPPVGVTDRTGLDLFQLATRFRALVELGRQEGVLPQLELWGFAKTLSHLGEVAFLAAESGEADALCLLDVYHIYKGGSAFGGLGMFPGSRMKCFHVNDYPADPARDAIKDEHRVYPGDGVAPLDEIFQTLRHNSFQGVLSLELFNRTYWQQDAYEVVKTGLEKTRAAVAKAFG